ncbi:MAG: hypothetical protein QXI84_10025 [Thermofilaceae archaeon]
MQGLRRWIEFEISRLENPLERVLRSYRGDGGERLLGYVEELLSFADSPEGALRSPERCWNARRAMIYT